MGGENTELFPSKGMIPIKTLGSKQNEPGENKIFHIKVGEGIFITQESKYVKGKVGDILSK